MILPHQPILVACLLLAHSAIAAGQTVEAAFSLNIVADPTSAKAGEKVTLSIARTNTSNKLIVDKSAFAAAAAGFNIRVTDPKGEEAGKTRLYCHFTGDRSGKDAAKPPLPPNPPGTPSVRAGTKVEITIALANKSQKEIFIPTDMSHAESALHIRITDPKGEEAGKTGYYRNITGDKSGKDATEPPLTPSQLRVVFGSGEILYPLSGRTVSQKLILNETFDLAQPAPILSRPKRWMTSVKQW